MGRDYAAVAARVLDSLTESELRDLRDYIESVMLTRMGSEKYLEALMQEVPLGAPIRCSDYQNVTTREESNRD